jgi:hypothetical protein
MEHREKRLALRRLNRGDPRDIIRLYEAQIIILKQEFGKATCQGCAKGFYERKIKKYEEEIRSIKEEKRFRGMDLNEKKV